MLEVWIIDRMMKKIAVDKSVTRKFSRDNICSLIFELTVEKVVQLSPNASANVTAG